MRAFELMTSPAVTIHPELSIVDAGGLLLDHGFSALPVVDDGGRLIGIVSAADLVHGRVGTDPRSHMRPVAVDTSEPPHTVGQVMTRTVVVVPVSADEADLAAAMLEHKVKSIPVVSDDSVVGMVAASDLLRLHVRSDDTIEADVSALLGEYSADAEGLSVSVDDGVVTLSGAMPDAQRQAVTMLAQTVSGVSRVRLADEASQPHSGAATDHRGLLVLDLEECMARLRGEEIGRIAFVHDGEPIVLPVNHAVDRLDIVIRTTWGAKWQKALAHSSVGFEVDGVDPVQRTGWSVLVKGTASIVDDDAEIERLEALALRSWADPGGTSLWVRIRSSEVSGRELPVHDRPVSP